MKKKNKDCELTNGEATLIGIYWFLCGLGSNIYMIHRDGFVNLTMAIGAFLMGGIMVPFYAIFSFFEMLSHIKIGF